MRKTKTLAIMLSAFFVSPAHASHVVDDYYGSIFVATPLAGPLGISAGTPIHYHFTYDPANLSDTTAAVNAGGEAYAAKTGRTFTDFASVETASLWLDPLADVSITVGSLTFTKADVSGGGKDCGDTCGTPFETDFGGGLFPTVEFLNGQFAGVSGVYQRGNYRLLQDPIASSKHFIPFKFILLDTAAPQGPPFNQLAALGSYTPSYAPLSAAPEPASWAMMVLGFGIIGAALRSRKTLDRMVLSI